MEFDFALTGLSASKLSAQNGESWRQVVDGLGLRSAAAQGLSAPVTDLSRLSTTEQRLYVYVHRQPGKLQVLGGIKIGSKHLFVRTELGVLKEMEALCVLDFYVHEAVQRQGVGRKLFEHFLRTELAHPGGIAYDRPSAKFLSFLNKYYSLCSYVPQSNNFVVFDQYWQLNPPRTSNNNPRVRGFLNAWPILRCDRAASPSRRAVGSRSYFGQSVRVNSELRASVATRLATARRRISPRPRNSSRAPSSRKATPNDRL
ncbi:MAG: hypothetical protein WDW36_006349 [Sanguina aurantia]